MPGRDIIVIGASAGGVETVTELISQLPTDFPAAIFIVIHISATSRDGFAQILERAGNLPACYPHDGEKFKPGHIYIALPDRHLILSKDRTTIVSAGPRENRSRPSIDVLFRSAALNFGTRVIGVVLTGMLDDGTAGLEAIVSGGGLAIIQDPTDAFFSDMPANAIHAVKTQYILPVSQMGATIDRLTRESLDNKKNGSDRFEGEEQRINGPSVDYEREAAMGPLVPMSCPDCGGPLHTLKSSSNKRFRCMVGHSFTMSYLLEGQQQAIEQLLWSSQRLMEEHAKLLQMMKDEVSETEFDSEKISYQKRATEYQDRARVLRKLLTNGDRV